MFLGAHFSIAQGFHNSCIHAGELNCQAMQIFTKNQLQWNAKEISTQERQLFRKALFENNIKIAFAHASYLINLASRNKKIYKKSFQLFLKEIQRCDLLGLKYYVIHPGSPGNEDVDFGINKVSYSIKQLPKSDVMILLETTAGQGFNIGFKFEHLSDIISKVKDKNVGICYDTCHTFSAGYDIRTKEEYEKTFRHFDKIIGLDRLKVFHFNDSAKPLGSRRDRHTHIGKGEIGLDAFKFILQDKRFKNLAAVIETPKDENMDEKNLKLLRSLSVL